MEIFFHNDFDGIASAGIFANFIDTRAIEKKPLFFHPIDYVSLAEYLHKDFIKQAAALDFPLNPTLLWWFDHHKTSFATAAIKKLYTPSQNWYWNTRARSCPSLLFSFFRKFYPAYHNDHYSCYSPLILHANIIDSAQYATPSEVYNFDNYYIAFNHILNHNYTNKTVSEFIDAIRTLQIDNFFSSGSFKDGRERVKEVYDNYRLKYNTIVKNYRNVIELNYANAGVKGDRYLGYLYNPDADFTITIDKRNSGYYIGIGYNPWKKKNTMNIGAFLKQFGGGGRKNVGAVLLKTEADCEIVLKKIRNKIVK